MYSLLRYGPYKTQMSKSDVLAKVSKIVRKFGFWFVIAELQLVCYLGKKFENSTYKILADMARTKGSVTDGRTDIREDKIYICLPQGETYNKCNTIIKPCKHWIVDVLTLD